MLLLLLVWNRCNHAYTTCRLHVSVTLALRRIALRLPGVTCFRLAAHFMLAETRRSRRLFRFVAEASTSDVVRSVTALLVTRVVVTLLTVCDRHGNGLFRARVGARERRSDVHQTLQSVFFYDFTEIRVNMLKWKLKQQVSIG